MLSDSNSFEAIGIRQHIRVEPDLKNKKIINPVDKVNGKWYIYKRRKC